MGVSNLAELRRTLRRTDDSISRSGDGGLTSAFRNAQDRVSRDLQERGRSEVQDGRGNTFVIERKKD